MTGGKPLTEAQKIGKKLLSLDEEKKDLLKRFDEEKDPEKKAKLGDRAIQKANQQRETLQEMRKRKTRPEIEASQRIQNGIDESIDDWLESTSKTNANPKNGLANGPK